MPSLMKNLTALAQKWQESDSDEASNAEGDINEEKGNSGNGANNGNEANAGNGANNGNEANTGNGANNGNEVNTGNGANNGNEANYYSRANDGVGAFQYHARDNDYGNNVYYGGGLYGDEGGYYGNFQNWMPTTPWMPPMSNSYPWCWHLRHQAGCQISPKSKGSPSLFLSLHPKPLNLHVSDPEKLLRGSTLTLRRIR